VVDTILNAQSIAKTNHEASRARTARVVCGPLRFQTIAKESKYPNPNHQVVDTNLNAQSIEKTNHEASRARTARVVCDTLCLPLAVRGSMYPYTCAQKFQSKECRF